MENTSLTDIENNLKIIHDYSNAIFIDEIKNSINFRIKKHEEYINISKEIILDNIHHLNIVQAETNKIIARKNKINELRELAEYSFDIKLI